MGAGTPHLAAAPTEALLDALFAEARLGLAFWDADLRYRRVSPELAAMNGLSVEDHLGRRPSDVLPQLGPRLEEAFREILDSGEPRRDVEVSGETPAAPGVTRHWLASYVPVRDQAGRSVGITGLIVEVTGERQAHRRADAAQQRSTFVDAELRALYAALPVGVAFLSRDLRYQRVNETLARMNGRGVAEHLGASLRDVLGEPAGRLEDALRQVMATRQPLELELTLPMPGAGGAERALEATYFPVLDAADDILGVGGVVRDVTDRRELEAEQSRLLREALVARAQAEAAQVRADDAREEAERSRADADRARGRMALLAAAGREMAASMDWETTLSAVVRSAVPAVADRAELTVVTAGGELRLVAVADHDPVRERMARERARDEPPDPGAPDGAPRVIRTGEAEVGPLAVIAPLRTPAGIIGALALFLGDSGRRFAADEVDLITTLAARAALHIHNARLYTERSHIARTLQASLRPRALPAVAGADVAARFLPAGDQNEVGGDFYDVFPSGDGVWTVIVGDVSGKGAEAAAITALARHTLRTASMLHDDPAANLALLDRSLQADGSPPDFCTVLYARACPGEGGIDVRFANGGHPAPLVLRADGRVESVETGRGPLVGAVEHARFVEATLQLAPGDLLLLYTDGVTEVRTSDPALGDRELRATLAAHAGATAEALVAAVARRAVELQPGPPRDDIALVAIRAISGRDGGGSAATVDG